MSLKIGTFLMMISKLIWIRLGYQYSFIRKSQVIFSSKFQLECEKIVEFLYS